MTAAVFRTSLMKTFIYSIQLGQIERLKKVCTENWYDNYFILKKIIYSELAISRYIYFR